MIWWTERLSEREHIAYFHIRLLDHIACAHCLGGAIDIVQAFGARNGAGLQLKELWIAWKVAL